MCQCANCSVVMPHSYCPAFGPQWETFGYPCAIGWLQTTLL